MSKKHFLGLCVLYSASAIAHTAAPTLEYNIHYTQGGKACLYVHVKSTVDHSGEFLLRFPEEILQPQIFSLEKTLTAESTEDENVTKIKLPADKNFEADYQLCIRNEAHHIDFPIIEDDFFIFKISDAFATPEDNSEKPWHIKIHMHHFPKDFNIASSFAPASRTLTFHKNIPEFKDSVIVGGNDIQINEIKIKDKPISVVQKGSLVGLNQPLPSYFEKLINTQRNFWSDHDFSHYLVVLQEHSCQGLNPLFNGRHYDHAMIFQLGNCKEHLSPARQTKWALSHELFHAWLGLKIKFDTTDHKSLVWFIEGFNDYYGLLFALRSGIISHSEYVEQYNDLMRYYFLMPIKHLSNEAIVQNYDNEFYYHMLAQMRGHFVAKELSLHLTQKNLSLDNIMQALYSQYQTHKTPLHKLDIDAFFKQHLDETLWEDFTQKIEFGSPLTFSAQGMGVFSALVNMEVEVPSFGFDLPLFFETQRIRHIDEDSAAFKAGLREGQQVLFHNINFIKTDKEVVIGVLENEMYHEFHFFPEKMKTTIPQYVIQSHTENKNRVI